MQRLIQSVLIIFLVSFSSSIPGSVHATNGAEPPSAEVHMAQGLQAFQRGAFDQAALSWTEALRQYEKSWKG